MAKRPSAGDLYYHVAFEKQGSGDDGAGGRMTAWAEQFRCRAAFHHLRGTETVLAARLEGTHTQVIRVRASTQSRAVTSDWRIRDVRTGDLFNIRDVEPQVDRQYISFLCQKGVAV